VDEVETLSGAFMLVRADAWRELGGFDTSFFMYSEELELCQRLRRHGWRVLMTPHAEVLHLVGGGDAKNPERIRLLTTAQMHFLRKFWGRPSALLGGGLIWLHGLLRLLGGAFGGRLVGSDRALKLRRAYAGIVLRPQSWWYGYEKRM
jgi:GT2 family glycosyltransferase